MRAPPPMKNPDGEEFAVGVNPSFGQASSGIGSLHDEAEDSDSWMMDGTHDGQEWSLGDLRKNDRIAKMLSPERLHRREIDRFVRDHFFNSDQSAMARFLDKLTSVMTVCACLFLTYCISSPFGRRLLPFYYVLSYPVLFALRYQQYHARKHHLFLIDFCYWANWVCLLYICAFPGSSEMFIVLFAITHSTLPWTVVAYRNSLVFHSLDRFTSVYIHVFPMAIFYALRWYPEDCSKWWWKTFAVDGEAEVAELLGADGPEWYITALYMTLATTIVFFIQQSLEMLFLNVLVKKRKTWIKYYTNAEYATLFRYSLNKPGAIRNALLACGPRYTLLMWLLLNVVFTLAGAIPVYVWYRYEAANALFAVFVAVWSIWQGSNFMIEVFSRRYEHKRPDKKAQSKA